MREGTSPLIRRGDYAAPAFWIRSVDLTFDLDPAKTMVVSKMQVERNVDVPAQPLRLHGEDITLTRVSVNGASVSFRHEDGLLVIDSLQDMPAGPFTLEIRNTCAPEKNTQLSGLYTSASGFFTQCEAEGFRRITYFLDRPDVMAVYTVTLRANKTTYPVLLSNGNLVDEGPLDNGRHFAKWHDPFPKPCYLFALVAADLVARQQTIRTRAGKDHLLQIYVRRGDLDKTEHAMSSLVASLVWDEARFGLPLDLERERVGRGCVDHELAGLVAERDALAVDQHAQQVEFLAVEAQRLGRRVAFGVAHDLELARDDGLGGVEVERELDLANPVGRGQVVLAADERGGAFAHGVSCNVSWMSRNGRKTANEPPSGVWSKALLEEIGRAHV